MQRAIAINCAMDVPATKRGVLAAIDTANLKRSSPHELAGQLTNTRFIACQFLGREIVKIALKPLFGVAAEIVKESPRVDAGIVHVIKADTHCIVSDRIQVKNEDVAFAANGFTLHL